MENIHGREEIVYSIIIKGNFCYFPNISKVNLTKFFFLVPPDKPKLMVISSTSDSLQLEWEVDESIGNGILGYSINFKRKAGDWEELQLGANINSYLLQNLWCAAEYQLYITAYNKVGTGLPCDIVNASTKGSGN